MIAGISYSIECLDLKKPFVTALRSTSVVEFVRVKVTLDDARSAYGEASATKAITGEDLQTISRDIDLIKGDLIGKSVDVALEILHKSTIGSSSKASLDIALFSLKVGSLKSYFNPTKPIKSDITISLGEQMLEDAKEYFYAGFDTLKLKVGKDIDHAITTTHAIAEALSEAKLIIDANQAWSLGDALRFVEAMKNTQILLLEQPVPKDALDDLRSLTKVSQIPILADEAVFSLDDAKRVIEGGYADMFNIKLMKCAGITKAIEMLEYAKEAGVKCMLGSMLEGSISIDAALFLASKYSDVIVANDLDSPLLYKEIPEIMAFELDQNSQHFVIKKVVL
ncbi:MAG: dipeptide epimerase [Sulfuricurvum sp.]